MLRDVLTDENGKLSSTRLVIVLTVVFFLAVGFVDIFTDVEINAELYELLKWIVTTGLFATGGRGFSQNLLKK